MRDGGKGMSEASGNGHRIVVGVDGSPASQEALAWAIRQAEATGASVDAVIAWHDPAVIAGLPRGPVATLEEAAYGEFAATVLGNSIREVGARSAAKVNPVVQHGNAAQVLLGSAEGADLLVVGSRGHGGFAGALLGSVSQHCAHHAPCPVVIIRGPESS
jgi:nucleotide-binding universal stress UspA family protein